MFINQYRVQKSSLTGTKLCLDHHIYSACFLFRNEFLNISIWQRNIVWSTQITIYIFKYLHLQNDSKKGKKENNQSLCFWLHILLSHWYQWLRGSVCLVIHWALSKSSSSVLSDHWEVCAPVKWNTPSGFHWEHCESPPGCWRGTRGRLQAGGLWLPGFYTSLFFCRWIWPLLPMQIW